MRRATPRHRASSRMATRDPSLNRSRDPSLNPSRAARSGALPWRGIWRQTRMDAAPLSVGLVVIAVAAFLSAVVPQATATVKTDEVRAAVSAPDANVGVVVTVPMSGPQGAGYELAPNTADDAEWARGLVESGMPAGLRAVLTSPVTALVGPELKAGVIADRPGRARFIYVASDGGPAVEWISGRAPVAIGKSSDAYGPEGEPLPIEVAVSESTATLMGLRPGDHIAVDSPQDLPLDVRVSGIYRASDATDAAWRVAPTLLQPTVIDGLAGVAVVGLMTSAKSVPYALLAVSPRGMTRTYTYGVDPTMFDGANAAAVDTEARGLASGKEAFATLGSDVRVRTELDGVLDAALARVEAASAQASVLLIGVLSVAIAVEILASRLVVERRSVVLSQWRSRGGTLVAIGAAAAAESVPLAAIGGFIGASLARHAAHGVTPWAWLMPPLVIAAIAPPMLAVWVAAAHGARARKRLARRAGISAARVRRIGAEALLVIAAAGSLATLRVRGIGASEGTVLSDIPVLAAPVLVALAVAVMMVSAQPRVLRAARSIAARSRGAVPILAAARMRATGMATTALVTAGVVGAIAASLAITVSDAQVNAAWYAVGGDVAVTTDSEAGLPGALAALDGTDGLTVATATLVTGAQAIGPKFDKQVSIVILDAEAFSRLLKATPLADEQAFGKLAGGAVDPGSVPVLVTSGGQAWKGVTLRWEGESVPVVRVGDTPQLPLQVASDQLTVVVDREALVAAVGHDIPANRGWIAGQGGGQRVDAIFASASDAAGTTVVTRQGWLAERRSAPVTRGLGWLFVGAGGVAVTLAVLAVLLMAASGSRERTHAIARIRVVGAPRSAADRVAWLEVAVPATIASAAGLLGGFLLTPFLLVALDLRSVTGGQGAPSLIIPWWTMALALGLGLIARISVALATASHGRERLGALMRVG